MARIDADVKDKLKASVLVEDVAEHLGLLDRFSFKNKGNALLGNCLSGKHQSTSGECCKLHRQENYFYCFQCKESFDAIELVMSARGVAYPEAVKYLAENWRKDLLDELLKTNLLAPQDKKTYAIFDAYEEIYNLGKDLLFKPEGKEAFDYLTKVRGYDPEKLLDTEWIYWPQENKIRAHLRKMLPDDRKNEADEIKLNGVGGDAFRAALPYRQRFGHIIGFAKRHTSKEGAAVVTDGKTQRYRWSFTAGLKKDDLFGLHNCNRSKLYKQSKQLIIVEGLPDASYLPALGIDNIVAVGQGCLSDKHIEGLKVYEVERAIIAFDNDKKAETLDNINETATKLEKAGIMAYILNPELLADCKDPDEFVVKYGIEKFEEVIEKAWSIGTWVPYYIASKNNLSTDLGKDKALSDAAKEYANLSRESDRTRFEQSMRAFFELSPDELKDELARAEESRKEKDRAEHRKLVEQKAAELLSRGKRDEAIDLLEDLESSEQQHSLPAIKLANQHLTDHDLYLDKYRGKEFVGLPQKTIPTLDRLTLGFRGIGLLAAAPNVGKTALVIQNAIGIIKANPDACVLFLSLEMPTNSIISRIRCHLSEMDWKTLALGSDRRQGSTTFFLEADWNKIQKGNAALDAIGNRLCVLSGNDFQELTVANVLKTVDALKAKTGCTRVFVVIDYLQVWPVLHSVSRDIGGNDLELDKWRIGQLKALSEALGDDPVIAISEARKPSGDGKAWADDLSDIMGSARGSYTPDMILMLRSILTTKDFKHFLGKSSDVTDEKIEQLVAKGQEDGFDIQKLSLKKGRDGMTRGDVFLKFYYRQNRFEELSRDALKDLIAGPQAPVKKSYYDTDDNTF